MITHEQALELATSMIVERFGAKALDGLRSSVVDEGGKFRVAFEPGDPNTLGGGPNVVLNAEDGTLIELYRTQ